MDAKKLPKIEGFSLNVTEDAPDSRDWMYTPPPVQLKTSMAKPRALNILNQGVEGACTGFGLAAVINLLNQNRSSKTRVSARMLYEMARKYDEWPGEEYSGSSCRGAIKGFANMGVCRETYWPYNAGKPGSLSVKAAKDARSNTIGAYYRLRPRISDFHAALNEAGAIFCSAKVHKGWSNRFIRNGVIPKRSDFTGGHAFALVGYNNKGFWIQNSWSKSWGQGGLALWTYEDWYENLIDAWVLSLALPTPQVWHLRASSESQAAGRPVEGSGAPSRGKIAGHFVHIDDGGFHDAGRYWSNLQDVKTTANNLAGSNNYDHLLLYAHGGLNSPAASAKRIAAMRDVFKENRIYPFHFMYDTGILEELKDVILSRGKRTEDRVGGFTDWWDRLLERLARRPGRALWREMKYGARSGFTHDRSGVQTLRALAEALSQGDGLQLKLHVVGHSTGGILLAHLLDSLEEITPKLRVDTSTLLAPAATMELFKSHFNPLLNAPADTFGIDSMRIYNLNEKLELDDSVGPYRKSQLYFVSRSFEEETPAPILGMELHSKSLHDQNIPNLDLVYSAGDADREARTTSTTHGGFDNDTSTMNDILLRVLGKKPKRPFTRDDLDY